MARERKLTVIIAGDASDAKRAFGEVEGAGQTMSQKMSDFGKKATVAVTLPAVAAGVAIFGLASDMNETISKSNTIFDENAGAIERWADGAARDFGQAKQQALDAASSFGNLFDQLGVAPAKTADMSMALTELASDFASFHNANPAEVIESIGAAFRGEFDSVQKFVPTINAAAVQQKALEMGLAATTSELDEQDKALATYQLLVEGAGQAVGDFDRTADGAANKQRILTAEFKDTATTLGTNLMPIGQQLLGWAGSLVGWFNKLGPSGQKVVLLMVGLAAAIGPVITVVTGLSTAIAFLAANPIVLLIAAIALLAIVVVKNWDTITAATSEAGAFVTDTVGGAIDWVQGKLSAIGAWIAANWGLLLAPLTGGISLVAQQTIEHWDGIVSFVTGLPGRIASAAAGMWDGMTAGFMAAVNFMIDAWNRIDFGIHIAVPSWVPGLGGRGFHVDDIFPDIPRLHSGGVFNSGRGEGLALLRDGETVLTPAQAAGVGAGGVTWTGNVIVQGTLIHERDVAAYLRRVLGRVVATGVRPEQLFTGRG